LILAQAALESGWGQRQIRRENGEPSYNLFGVKALMNPLMIFIKIIKLR
jgi:flagellum-specific peptidoglycan hydrolase FlgJ